jgi:hypothetical protein
MRVTLTGPAGAILALALTGCSAPSSRGPCEGLVYTDAGLTREHYAPCAKAMAGKLDELRAAVEIIFDKDLSKAERTRGRQACLKSSSDLSRLMKQAGGADKLYRMEWNDMALNQFNIDVESARSEYFLYCYYGAVGPRPTQITSSHARAREFAAALR